MNCVETAVTAIYRASNDELDQMVEAIKLRRTALSKAVVRAIAVGDTVEFIGRDNLPVTGTVTKVNRKTLLVKRGFTTWRVTASLCKKVELA